MGCRIQIDGKLLRSLGLAKADLKAAAAFFATKSCARIGVPFRAVTIILQNDRDRTKRHANPRTALRREKRRGTLQFGFRQPEAAR